MGDLKKYFSVIVKIHGAPIKSFYSFYEDNFPMSAK